MTKFYTREEINEKAGLSLTAYQFRELEKKGHLVRLPIRTPHYTAESVNKFLNPSS